MVRTRIGKHATTNRKATKEMIEEVFGRTLTIQVSTRTIDEHGQLSALSTANTTFIGDLQFGRDLDQKMLEMGIVEVGEGVLYIHPTALTTLPNPQDIIVDGSSDWEIIEQIEAPELGGTVCHYSYRCRRRINSGDN
jgi:Fe2+ transport system protein FeoA|tara:strand:- start:6008 stop:6418 length:411 start_codon:yes stop_codon:yes gene_type:complete